MLFEDGRRFSIAGSVISDGTTIIGFSAITLGARPASFPIPVTDIPSPIMFVELIIVDLGTIVVAMSLLEYNTLAIAEQTRTNITAPSSGLFRQVAQGIARRCGSCGKR